MTCLPRIALGTVQPEADHRLIVWGLISALERLGIKVQSFSSQAHFAGHDASKSITGQRQRHVDSWLMSPNTCREIFWHGAQSSDLAIVEGNFSTPSAGAPSLGGRLDTLCSWLDLPQLAVIDVTKLDSCRLAPRPDNVDGILLDRVSDSVHAQQLKLTFETFWKVPVVGYLNELNEVREQVSSISQDTKPTRSLFQKIGDRVCSQLDFNKLLRIACRRAFPSIKPVLFQRTDATPRLKVAFAFDEAFHCYFPDTLDLLEAHGAFLQDFSPLHSDRLPIGTELVYFGCGQAERFAEALACNHCMKEALRRHVRNGGRVYAEGSGLAYLMQHINMPDGQRLSMSGLLPLEASYNPPSAAIRPVSVKLVRDNWLGRTSSKLRGYLNPNWLVSGTGATVNELVGRHQVVGSRLNVDFAAQPEFLRSFFDPVPLPASAKTLCAPLSY